MRIEASTRLRTITAQQWWYLALAVLVTLPLVIGLAFQVQIYSWYLAAFVQPELEKVLGFRAGEVQFPGPEGQRSTYAVVAVVPGGVFDRAGVKPGDVPFGYVHGHQSGFLGHLHEARGSEVDLRFVNQRDAFNGNWTYRRVTVFVPAKNIG